MDQNEENSNEIYLGSARLKSFFINHLDRIYFAKRHLVKRLPELAHEASFNDLKLAIAETVDDVDKQIARMKLIYKLCEADMTTVSINGPSA